MTSGWYWVRISDKEKLWVPALIVRGIIMTPGSIRPAEIFEVGDKLEIPEKYL